MKISKLLSNFFIIFLVYCFFIKTSLSNEPVDIWEIEKKNNPNKIKNENNKTSNNEVIQGVKIEQQNENIIVNQELDTSHVKLAGLYDPADNGLTIDMWTNSDGEEIKNLLKKINSTELSNFSNKILDIALLTNSYLPANNISAEEFIEYKFKYLIKKGDFDLIKKFLIKNPSLKNNHKLVRNYADYYLSNSQLDKSCEIFDHVKIITNDYLNEFKIYCLIEQNKKEEAQLLFDLKSEFGNPNNFFDKKFNTLMGYDKNDDSISDKNILNFHLSHKTNENFSYEPKIDTPNYIWKYLSTSNLLKDSDLINIEDSEQVKLIETATNEGIYEDKELFDLYKRFQFNINQLLSVKESYKLLSNIEGRALLYQGILITNEAGPKIDLIKTLRESFVNEGIENAFNNEMSRFLKELDPNEIPSNYTGFYNNFLNKNEKSLTKIKFNNKIIHQSKLLNYFIEKKEISKIEKETDNILKSILKDKDYVITTNDEILLESLKYDGVKISKKYSDRYSSTVNIPPDIQAKINNRDLGLILLRIVEIIGEDQLKNLGSETLNFILITLNQLDLDQIRDKIILKTLPIRV